MIRVFLIDDQPATRAVLRLRLELEPDVVVVCDAGRGEDAIAQVNALAPDVVILGLLTPLVDLASATTLLSRLAGRHPVIVLGLYDDLTTRTLALAAGAAAVVSKHEPDDHLVTAIRSCP